MVLGEGGGGEVEMPAALATVDGKTQEGQREHVSRLMGVCIGVSYYVASHTPDHEPLNVLAYPHLFSSFIIEEWPFVWPKRNSSCIAPIDGAVIITYITVTIKTTKYMTAPFVTGAKLLSVALALAA